MKDSTNSPQQHGQEQGALAERVAELEEKLRALEKRDTLLRTLMDAADDSALLLDREQNIVELNATAASRLGGSREELLGAPVAPWVSKQALLAGEPRTQEALRSGKPTHFEVEFEGRIVHVGLFPVLDAEGAVEFLAIRARDMTDRRLADKVLRESAQRWQSLVQNIPDIVASLARDGTIASVNHVRPPFKVTDVVGKPIYDFIALEHRAKVRTRLERVLETQHGESFLVLGAGADGPASSWYEGRIVPIMRDKEAVGVTLIITDVTGRKRAERELKRERNLLRTLIDNLPDNIYVKDREGRYVVNNTAHMRLLGATMQRQVSGQTDFDFFPHELAARYYADEQAIMESGQPAINREEPVVDRATACQRWFATTKVPLRNSKGVITGIVGISRDITEQKRAQETLQRREEAERQFGERLTALHEVIRDLSMAESCDALARRAVELGRSRLGFDRLGIWFVGEGPNVLAGSFGVDEEGRIRDERETRLGVSPNSPLGAVLARQQPSAYFEDLVLRNHRGEAVGRGSSAVAALWDGEEVQGTMSLDNLTSGQPITEHDRELLTIFASATAHLCRRKRIEEALRRQALVFETIHDGVIISDLQGGIVDWNPSAERMFGYAKEEVLGKSPTILHRPQDAPTLIEDMRRAAMQETRWVGEVHFIRKDGSEGVCETIMVPLRDDTGQIVGVVGVNRDITMRRSLEEQLSRAHKMEAIGRLAGGIAHDFNNLLTAIRGYGELALSKLDDSNPLRHGLAEIRRAADCAASLTNQLLAFSRRQVVQPRILDINALVVDMGSMLRPLIGKNIKLCSNLAPGLGKVKADPGQIEQVIMNLVLNARDAIADQGEITVETANVDIDQPPPDSQLPAQPGPYVMLAVSDTGCGMDEETLAQIFEPFFTTKPRGEGNGLGLATIYGIVEQNRGFIRVHSQPGQGASFRIFLPRVEAAEPIPAKPDNLVQTTRGDETVLLVEDEEVVRGLARLILDRNGYNVIEAEAAEGALAAVEQHDGPIDLLLTDITLPGMNGRDLARRIAAQRPGIKILYMSGYADEIVDDEGLAQTGLAFIQKPFKPEDFERTVRALLDPRR